MSTDRTTTLTPTASQTVGPFFHIGLSQLTATAATGSTVTVRGRVLDGDETPVPDAVLEVWSEHSRQQPGDDGAGFCRVFTSDDGSFSLTIQAPDMGAAGEPGQARHLSVVVFMRGLLRHLITRLYFPDESVNDRDPVLALVPPDRRSTLIGRRASDGTDALEWDIVMQGPRETVFFEC